MILNFHILAFSFTFYQQIHMKKKKKKTIRKKRNREKETQGKKKEKKIERIKKLTCPPEVGAIEAISAIQKMAHPNPTNVTKYIQIIAGSPPLGRT